MTASMVFFSALGCDGRLGALFAGSIGGRACSLPYPDQLTATVYPEPGTSSRSVGDSTLLEHTES
jgi:hypothetical protein